MVKLFLKYVRIFQNQIGEDHAFLIDQKCVWSGLLNNLYYFHFKPKIVTDQTNYSDNNNFSKLPSQ